MAVIKAISVSKEKRTKKTNVEQAELKEGFGIVGDAHAGAEKRQVSLLSTESIEKMKSKGLKVAPGDFAENITVEEMDLLSLEIGERLRLGSNAVLEISQKGKTCHAPCSIYYQAGDCIMPKEGIFARVIRGGSIKVGDKVEVVRDV